MLRFALEPRNGGQKSPALRSFAGVPLEYVLWITSAVETALGQGLLGTYTCKCGSQGGDYGLSSRDETGPRFGVLKSSPTISGVVLKLPTLLRFTDYSGRFRRHIVLEYSATGVSVRGSLASFPNHFLVKLMNNSYPDHNQ